jgi:aldehyde dehydrogenase (NAD+)
MSTPCSRDSGQADGGNYVKPTLFAATNDMTIAREEIFGPVLSLIAYRDEAEAIRIANDTPHGLHAYVAAGDVRRGREVARQIGGDRRIVGCVVLKIAS